MSKEDLEATAIAEAAARAKADKKDAKKTTSMK